ncbi:MAG: hypothetical protein JO281_20025 [Pseudonocardiales bacterium]|nr:hypothetical protein [Pseudonocardiales bacterium]
MTASGPRPSIEQIRAELECLRRGPALGHPGVVRILSPPLQDLLLASQGSLTGQAQDVPRMVAALRRAIDALAQHERLHAQVEFNLLGEHSYPTLGQRQESLAALLGCTAKTVRRSASRALDTLAMLIATGTYPAPPHSTPSGTDQQARQHVALAEFWGLTDTSRVDIVCSELPTDTRSPVATPGDPYFMRYGQFADLDALFYLRVRLARLFPQASIHDFVPSEYYDAGAGTLIVIGSPTWNSKHREFQPHLPIRFHTGGDDPGLVVPGADDHLLRPTRTAHGHLLADLSMVTRLTLAGTTVFLLSGCLALGTFGAAKCFLRDPRGAGNARYLTDLVGDRDFVLITETHRIGGITDTPDFTTTPPLLILTSSGHNPFQAVIDNRGG